MKQYYYLNAQGQQMPPVDYETLRNVGINADTMIWFEGMKNWIRACEIPELHSIIKGEQIPYGVHPPKAPQCPQPQSPYQTQLYQSGYTPSNSYKPNMSDKPQNYLWLGICSTVLCCLPLGVVSIIYASKVDSYWNQGMYAQAQENAEKAKMWGIASAAVGFVVSIILFIIGFLGAI